MLYRYLLAPLAALLLAATLNAQAQTGAVGIGTTAPDASAALDIVSSAKGVLLPRLTQAQRDAIASPAVGLTLYNTTTAHLNTWTGTAWDASLSATEQVVQNAAITYGYTKAEQVYTVPANVYTLGVDAVGAGGGPNGGGGGLGGRVQTNLAVQPGQVLRIYVGGMGTIAGSPGTGGGGYNGGGNGTSNNYGGGGGTDIRRGGATPADRIVVAGGGGGAAGVDGGAGGGLEGAVGGQGAGTYPGQGGTQTAGGAGALGVGDGAFFQGGTGNFSGGGGGWYGGGGGGRAGYYGGGGGGSSYVSAAGSGTVHTQGFRQGNGYVTLTPGLAIPAPALDGRNFVNLPSSADNLGNHTATQKLDLAANKLVGNGGTTGLAISSAGVISTDGPVNAGGNVNLGANQLVGNGGSTGLAVSSTGSVGIGGPAPLSAALAVTSTSQGFLPPRMGPTERDAINAPDAGLTIYNTYTNKLNTWNGKNWTEALGTSEQPFQNSATTFAFTGTEQSYTVPVGVYSLGVDARGGQGGASGNAAGGLGGRVQTTLVVTPGEVLKIYVGGAGGTAQNGNVGSGAGYNGGGLGTNGNGGGGGGTDLRRGGNTPTDRLVVAGGGGGSAGGAPGVGGGGGGLVGATGAGTYPGGGGTQTAGGSGGNNIGSGSFFEGGRGFSSGGGGGWYGGGGGSWVGSTGGGGGGSSFVAAAGSSATTHTPGYQAGPGSITLTPGLTYATPVLSGVNFVNVPGDNLGNHTATTNLNLGPYALVGNGGTTGLTIANSGTVKVNNLGNGSSTRMVTAAADGTLAATALPADAQQLSISGSTLALTNGGSVALTSLGDNLGNHLATQNLSLGTNALVGSGGTTGLTIATSGNVGLGTTTAQPSTQKLDVRGNLRLGADGGQVTGLGQTIEFVGPGLNTDPVGFYRVNPASDQSELRVVVGDASDVNDRFSVGRTSASTEGALAAGTFTPTFTVRGDGNVGIGTSTPQAGLHVDRSESATTTALGVLLSGGTSGNPSIELRGTTSTPYIDFSENPNLDYSTRLISQAGVLSVLRSSGSGILLNVAGQVQANGVVLTSDQRFKQAVRPLRGALASVLALRGVRYEWNALGVQHGGTAGASQVGVLAQEVEKIYPELVSTDKDGYKAVNYAQLTPVLIEALKEQQAQIEALKATVAAAKAEAGAANTRAASAEAKATQATATLETFEARLRRLESGASGQAQR